jgi:tRNA1Val (adenine37-N6)-methyltransferase
VIPLHDDETVEDLRTGGFRLIQKKDGFRFGEDSVFLAAFAASFYSRNSPHRALRAADLGCGCGAVTVLLARRLPSADLAGVELVPRIAAVAARNARLDGLEGRVRIVRDDVRRLAVSRPDGPFPHGRFDLVVSNPPYRLPTTVPPAGAPVPVELVVAREEVACSLDDLALVASKLLRPRGRLVLAHGPDRLPDLMEALRRHHLEPETLRMVLPAEGRAPSCLLVSATANGRPGGFRILPPLVVRDAKGAYGAEAAAIYGSEPPLSPDALFAGLEPAGPDPLSSGSDPSSLAAPEGA